MKIPLKSLEREVHQGVTHPCEVNGNSLRTTMLVLIVQRNSMLPTSSVVLQKNENT